MTDHRFIQPLALVFTAAGALSTACGLDRDIVFSIGEYGWGDVWEWGESAGGNLWAIQAAPLMIGADMAQLDPWTIDLLTNDEVLAVTNDPLGTAGGSVWKDGGRLEVWARPLHDGTWAVGLFNRGLEPYAITARWEDIGLSGTQPVRDLWAQEDLGEYTDGYTVEVPRHGTKFIRVGRGRDE